MKTIDLRDGISREMLDVGAGSANISEHLVVMLNKFARLLIQANASQMVVHSVYRPGDTGQHGKGNAIDFHVPRLGLLDLFLLAEKTGFSGIGIYPYWNNPGLHVDVRPGNPGRWGFAPLPPATESRMLPLNAAFIRVHLHIGQV